MERRPLWPPGRRQESRFSLFDGTIQKLIFPCSQLCLIKSNTNIFVEKINIAIFVELGFLFSVILNLTREFEIFR